MKEKSPRKIVYAASKTAFPPLASQQEGNNDIRGGTCRGCCGSEKPIVCFDALVCTIVQGHCRQTVAKEKVISIAKCSFLRTFRDLPID